MTSKSASAPRATDTPGIFERPDGFYWQDRLTGKEYGPFRTLGEAAHEMEYNDESDFEPGETLAEAEDELGLSGWIDPDTGELSEGSYTHIEDH